MPIDVKVVWHNRPFEAIIQEVVSEKHDLLLKMAHQHDKLEAVIFTPTDWHLLRKCPCPVWMVKDQPWPEGGKALVAVNLASEENYHNTLNEKLVRETLSLAEEVNHTEVHLIGAYPVTPINIAIELPDFDPSVYNDAIRRGSWCWERSDVPACRRRSSAIPRNRLSTTCAVTCWC